MDLIYFYDCRDLNSLYDGPYPNFRLWRSELAIRGASVFVCLCVCVFVFVCVFEFVFMFVCVCGG